MATKEELTKAFKEFDADGSDSVEAHEILAILKKLKADGIMDVDDDLEAIAGDMLRKADTDSNKKISLREFLQHFGEN